MIRLIKQMIKFAFGLFGIEISRKAPPSKKVLISDEEVQLYALLYSSDSILNRKFYNIGAGSFFHPYWTNIDYHNNFYDKDRHFINIEYDLMKIEKLPIEDNSAEIVYISHVLEHISDLAAHNIISECYRILKPNGLLRIVQPDIDCYYNAYQRGDQVFLANIQKLFHLNYGRRSGLVFQ